MPSTATTARTAAVGIPSDSATPHPAEAHGAVRPASAVRSSARGATHAITRPSTSVDSATASHDPNAATARNGRLRLNDAPRHPALHCRPLRHHHAVVREDVASHLGRAQQADLVERHHAAAHLPRDRDGSVQDDDVASTIPSTRTRPEKTIDLADGLPLRNHDPTDQHHLVARTPGRRTGGWLRGR